MKTAFLVQTPQSPATNTLGYLLGEKARNGEYDETLVSVAYMTVAGLRSLLAAFPAQLPRRSKWLVGLDDWITQPGAIDVVLGLTGAELRVISYASKGFRFHPKVYIFQEQSTPRSFMILGSANLTAQGLAGNGEANAVFHLEGPVDFAQVSRMWASLWRQGHTPTRKEFSAYRKQYKIAQKSRPKKKSASKHSSLGLVILTSDEAQLDPAEALTCWIECGHITAMGRELELKAEQGIFFGLRPTGGPPKRFDFRVSSGNLVQLRMKYQANHMWRLQLTKDVPEVAIGLRPKRSDGSLGRSPYVAIIGRTDDPGVFELSFVDLKSREFKKLVKTSIELGTYGKTTARQFGWC